MTSVIAIKRTPTAPAGGSAVLLDGLLWKEGLLVSTSKPQSLRASRIARSNPRRARFDRLNRDEENDRDDKDLSRRLALVCMTHDDAYDDILREHAHFGIMPRYADAYEESIKAFCIETARAAVEVHAEVIRLNNLKLQLDDVANAIKSRIARAAVALEAPRKVAELRKKLHNVTYHLERIVKKIAKVTVKLRSMEPAFSLV